jgi:signal transduction histidine kinase|tara:strand:+ start:645 stop:1934 length:1290 start_codon:yes stop_codon:yes gene_type:complete
MRRRLAWVFVALAVMLAVGFLVPLARSVSSQARLRALAGAQSDARGVATALAAVAGSTGTVPGTTEVEFVLNSFGSPDLMVVLSDGTVLGSNIPVEEALELALAGSVVAEVTGGAAAIVPVAFGGGELIVVTAFVDHDTLREGVTSSWLILTALGLIVVIGSVPIADRFAVTIVRPVRDLSDAAHRWAGGDLTARVAPGGPPEVVESGRAFNQLAERLTDLLAAERERVADLSHRLRTPLAALRLQAESARDPDDRAALITDIVHMESEVTALIEDVRRTDVDGPASSDLANMVDQRMGFWQVVAAAQDRTATIVRPDDPIPVGVTDADVLAVLDNLVQNVLTHTEAGVAFNVSVTADPPTLTVADEGEGLASPAVFSRGTSGGGSSGLGLDIVRQIAEGSGGSVTLGRGPGTSIKVRFGTPADPEETA